MVLVFCGGLANGKSHISTRPDSPRGCLERECMLSAFCRGCFPTVAIGCGGVVLSLAVGWRSLRALLSDVLCRGLGFVGLFNLLWREAHKSSHNASTCEQTYYIQYGRKRENGFMDFMNVFATEKSREIG